MSFINYKVINTYLQTKEGNMAKIVNYVYSMIIFLSLFLVATKAERKPFITFKIFFSTLYIIYYPIF